jgi:hypothetical protein
MMFDPVFNASVPNFIPVQAGPGSFVLGDKLAAVQFLYREPMPPPQNERWVPRWVKPYWPTGLRIEMTPLEPDPSKIGPTTLTMPVFVRRMAQGVYFD